MFSLLYQFLLGIGCYVCICGGSKQLDLIYSNPTKSSLPDSVPQSTHPQFVYSQSANVTAILHETAHLKCRVKGAGNETIAWIKHRNNHLLTVGSYVYASDFRRFKPIHPVLTEDYLLEISNVKASDEGLYKCQLSTTPVMSHYVNLQVSGKDSAHWVTSSVAPTDSYPTKSSLTDSVPQSPHPKFVYSQSANVSAILHETAHLKCRVKGVGNKTVTWIRHKDNHLLTVGSYVYASDFRRFRPIHPVLTEDYLLEISNVKASDQGLYECQLSTVPVMSHYVYLQVSGDDSARWPTSAVAPTGKSPNCAVWFAVGGILYHICTFMSL